MSFINPPLISFYERWMSWRIARRTAKELEKDVSEKYKAYTDYLVKKLEIYRENRKGRTKTK